MLKKTFGKSVVAFLILTTLFIAGKCFHDNLFFNKKVRPSWKKSSKSAELFAVTVAKKNVVANSTEVNVELYQTYTEKDLLSAVENNCNYVRTLNELDKVILPNGALLDLGSYKKKKRDEFLKNFQHPPSQKMYRPTVKPQLVCFVSFFYSRMKSVLNFSEHCSC